jgi:hypothetical protein
MSRQSPDTPPSREPGANAQGTVHLYVSGEIPPSEAKEIKRIADSLESVNSDHTRAVPVFNCNY